MTDWVCDIYVIRENMCYPKNNSIYTIMEERVYKMREKEREDIVRDENDNY